MFELASKLGFRHQHLSPYYPQENCQVDAINKSLKTILKSTVNSMRSNCHLMLYLELWVYRTSIKTAMGFSPFQRVHGVESNFPIECEIPSLKIVVELLPDIRQIEEHLVYHEHLDEQCWDVALVNEAHKKHVKSQYEKYIHPRVFFEGDLVLVYDQDTDALGAWKFNPMWHVPYTVWWELKKGSYELLYYDGNVLSNPRNGIYLKKYYAWAWNLKH